MGADSVMLEVLHRSLPGMEDSEFHLVIARSELAANFRRRSFILRPEEAMGQWAGGGRRGVVVLLCAKLNHLNCTCKLHTS